MSSCRATNAKALECPEGDVEPAVTKLKADLKQEKWILSEFRADVAKDRTAVREALNASPGETTVAAATRVVQVRDELEAQTVANAGLVTDPVKRVSLMRIAQEVALRAERPHRHQWRGAYLKEASRLILRAEDYVSSEGMRPTARLGVATLTEIATAVDLRGANLAKANNTVAAILLTEAAAAIREATEKMPTPKKLVDVDALLGLAGAKPGASLEETIVALAGDVAAARVLLQAKDEESIPTAFRQYRERVVERVTAELRRSLLNEPASPPPTAGQP